MRLAELLYDEDAIEAEIASLQRESETLGRLRDILYPRKEVTSTLQEHSDGSSPQTNIKSDADQLMAHITWLKNQLEGEKAVAEKWKAIADRQQEAIFKITEIIRENRVTALTDITDIIMVLQK